MNLNKFKIISQDEKSYKIGHPSGKSIVVEKAGLSKKAHEHIQKLADGGVVEQADAPPSQEDKSFPVEEIPEEKFDASTGYQNTPEDEAYLQKRGLASSSNPIPVDQPAPAAAPVPEAAPQAAQQNPLASAASQTGELLNREEQQAQQYANGVAGANAPVAASFDQAQKQLALLQAEQQKIQNEYKAKDDAYMAKIQNEKIDPNRVYQNMDTGSRVLSGIAMILGGAGSAVSGQPNLAVKMMDDAVNRDIEAQKNEQGKTMNLWKMNREAYGDDVQANLATRNQILSGVQLQIQKASASTSNLDAQMRANQLLDQIQREKIANNRQQAVFSQQANGPGQQGKLQVDPSQLVNEFVKDPAQQKEVYEEIKRAQNVAKNQDKILRDFDEAVKENTVARTGAGLLRTPGSVMSLHQNLLPNFKQIDGTVRQAAMDETFHNVTPAPGDNDHKIAQKRRALEDWMHSELSAPTAKGNGLDLSRFVSTAYNEKPDIKMMNGAKYQKVPGGWQKVK